ncbi:MFS transporter [Alicyclobacillus sendaiensis]|uniref:MFS transporter n=1 Tax=Alicyclobacillus sendaiensis PA2 TaxID=3029425 RepID=A0ABT6XXF7_ALISE|nr:MFS transporter [Alicyclobacillus sendaiensis]MDI9259784.1 MFS transporter [Alicyclobacillus sendaiensis PA2]
MRLRPRVDAFHAFLAGRFFSRVGDKIFLLALPLLIQGMGYGAALLSFANAVQYVANWAGAPLGGYLTERHSRKTVMLAVHTAQAAAILGVIASLSMRSFFPFVLVLSIFFLHLASMVNRVNRFSLTTLLRQRNQIPHANAEIQLMESAARLVGPWVAGIVMVHLRLRAALGLDLLSFLIMAMVVWVALRLPVNERNGARSAAARARDLWRWRFEGPDGVRRVLLVNGFVNAAFTFISGFNVFLMSSAHHLSVMVISWILTATAAASLLFGLSLRANLAHVAEPSLTKMRLALALSGIGMAGLPFARSAELYLVAYAACILGMEWYQAQVQTWLQMRLAGSELNRAFVATSHVQNAITPVWMVVGGFLWRALGPWLPLSVCAACALAGSLSLWVFTRSASKRPTMRGERRLE